MSKIFNIETSLFQEYDTILFDLDQTIWDGFNPMGQGLPARDFEPPFKLVDEHTVQDIRGNVCRLQENVRDVLKSLDLANKNLGIVSRSGYNDIADSAQPAIMLLKSFDIDKFFSYIVVVKENVNKADYARPEGKTLFIDDDSKWIEQVNQRGLCDVLNRRRFVEWASLFTEPPKEVKDETFLSITARPPIPLGMSRNWMKLAAPETYTDKSDVENGIAPSRYEVFEQTDHLTLNNQRDHVWQEPYEPQESFFLDPNVLPKLDDKMKDQHPDKGGLATSSLTFAEYDLFDDGDGDEEEMLDPNTDPYETSVTVTNFIEEIQARLPKAVDDAVYYYHSSHSKSEAEDASDYLLPQFVEEVGYAGEEWGLTDDEIRIAIKRLEPIIKQEIIASYTYFSEGYGGGVDTSQFRYFTTPQKTFTPDEIRTEIAPWLATKFNNETFSVDSLVTTIDRYFPNAWEFGKKVLTQAVRDLPKSIGFEDAGNNRIFIGADKRNIHQVSIDVDKLKEHAFKPIEAFKSLGETTTTPDGIYIYIDRGADILGVAHLDTTQNLTHFDVENMDDERVIKNAQLDDRLGTYILLDLLPQMGFNYDILLTEGEETGRSTAKYFKPTKQYKWIFSFDRMGMDTVMYQYQDEATKKMMENEGFLVGNGSFSDIAFLEDMGVKGFNFGTGYYDNHGEKSHAIESHIIHNVKLFQNFYNKYKNTTLPHTHTHRYDYKIHEQQQFPPASKASPEEWQEFFKQKYGPRYQGKLPEEYSSLKPLSFADLPKGEQYPDYTGITDPSPKDPKKQDELEDDNSSTRKELQRRYYVEGENDGFHRPEVQRPLTPYATLQFATLNLDELPVDTDLHKPNSILVHEGVADVLSFHQCHLKDFIARHEVEDDYNYVPEK